MEREVVPLLLDFGKACRLHHLLITLQLTPINQCRVMVLIKPTSHLRVTSLADLVVHRTLLVDCTHPDNVTDLCQSMVNSRIMEDIMLANL